MDTIVFIVLGVFSPIWLGLSLLLLLGANVAVIYGIVCIIEWVSNLRRRTKSLKQPTKVGTFRLELDDIVRRHEEAYIASLKNTDKGNDK